MSNEVAEYGIVIAKDVMVPMRDDVRLATDIYRPARDGEPVPGRFPVILGRTSYDKTSPQSWVEPVAEFFTRRGYVVALQDLRGRHRSEGTGQYFHAANPNEGRDGYDTVEWLAARPWCNGRIGTVGSSHGAIIQQCLALYRPPHLAAMWPDVGPVNSHAHNARMGGAFAMHIFGALFLHAHDAQELAGDRAGKQAIFGGMARLREWLERTPFKPGQTPLAVVPNLEKTLFDYYYRGAYDEFWAQECNDQARYFDRHADVPAVYSGGWFDPFSEGTTAYYRARAAQSRTPQRLVMGPWTHGDMRAGVTYAGDVDFGPAAAWGDARYNAERLGWFDRWLKGVPTGVEHDAPVRIFVMGGGDGRRNAAGRMQHGGAWREEREWPLARAQRTAYYLRSGGGLTVAPPGAGDPPAAFQFDPAHPVPTIAAPVTGFNEWVPLCEGLNPTYVQPRARMRSVVLPGAAHQQEAPGIVGARSPYLPLATRPDVLVFQTPPLREAVEVTGACVVRVWIASSAADTDFTAKLVDVCPPNEDYPDGYHMNLVDSIIRTRFRDGWDREVLLQPGAVYEVQITLAPTSNRFEVGHRIRLDISSSNFPRFDVNPNTGEPLGRHTHTVVARNTVYLDRARPSQVILPVIPG
jgi:putative CocE/NonD family hydrolase